MKHSVRAAGPWEYFCRKVDIKHPRECWNWLASCGTPGYGNWYYSIFDLPKAGAAHRRSYMLFNGYVDSGVVICHTCKLSLTSIHQLLVVVDELQSMHACDQCY